MEAFMTNLEGILSTSDLEKISRLWTPTTNLTLSTDAQRVLKGLETRKLTLQNDIGFLTEEQWKWLLRTRIGIVINLSDLVTIYRRHQPIIAQLSRYIAITDKLIEQIVFCLYGIKEEDYPIIET